MYKELSEEDLRIIHNFKRSNPSICYYCGRHLTKKEKTVDHKIPLSREGRTWYSNLCIACSHCNVEKGDMTDYEYIEYLSNKNKEYKNNVKQIIREEKYRHKTRDYILQEHDIMEARQDSKKRVYIRGTNKYIKHINNLFQQIEMTM
jgi:CRISPR/Cas system Type II protein with McrA/HNH and RuvC-like nuclease domain